MKIIRVQYTVKEEYVETNKSNIQAVMEELRANPVEGLKYASYQLPDGNSFMHFSIAKDGETSGKVNDLESFKKFRAELKESEPLSPPQAEELTLVASGFDIF